MVRSAEDMPRISGPVTFLQALRVAFPPWPILAAVIAALGFSGPFGTYEDLSLPARLVYWTLAICGAGAFLNGAVLLVLQNHWMERWPRLARLTAASFVGGVPGALAVAGIEAVFRGLAPTAEFLGWLWVCVGVFGGVAVIVQYRTPRAFEAKLVADAAARAPFLERLPPEIGRNLVSISMDDHYLEVTTTDGRERLKMRLSDALDELQSYPGVHIHRSHWIAESALVRLEKRGRNRVACLVDGRALPVARSKADEIEARLADDAP